MVSVIFLLVRVTVCVVLLGALGIVSSAHLKEMNMSQDERHARSVRWHRCQAEIRFYDQHAGELITKDTPPEVRALDKNGDGIIWVNDDPRLNRRR
jgi:hypothetical protein